MLILWVMTFVLVFVGARDIARHLWYRAEESVFDNDISVACRSGNPELAVIRTEDRRRWLMVTPQPTVSRLGWPVVMLALVLSGVALFILAVVVYLWERFFNRSSQLYIGPYRQVR